MGKSNPSPYSRPFTKYVKQIVKAMDKAVDKTEKHIETGILAKDEALQNQLYKMEKLKGRIDEL